MSNSIELVPYPEVDTSMIAGVLHRWTDLYSHEMREQGIHQLPKRYADRKQALVTAEKLKAAHIAGVALSFLVKNCYESDNYVGVASLIPGLELLKPKSPFRGLLPNAVQKKINGQEVAIHSAQSVNASFFIGTDILFSLPFGVDTAIALRQEAADRFSSRTCWALAKPDSLKESYYTRGGFIIDSIDRFDEREGIMGILPNMTLLTAEL